jgi:CheY-like chemotaxis protein
MPGEGELGTRELDTEKPLVLVVDDEATTLETLRIQIGADFRVMTAEDGNAALAVMEEHGPFTVIVTDQQMPGMGGLELLERVRERHPDTVRVLHTAQTELAVAVAAINEGKVFSFLCKPCPTEAMRGTVREAVDQYHAGLAEREMLERTLQTSLHALFSWMEMVNPRAFARAERIRDLAQALCRELDLTFTWQIEVAAMASQLGAVTLPAKVIERLNRGLPLPDDEQKMTHALPEVAVRLLHGIPKLDEVVEIMDALHASDTRRPDLPVTPPTPAVSVLRAAIEYQALVGRGVTVDGALAILERSPDQDPTVLAALGNVLGGALGSETVRALRVSEIEVGMRIAEDVISVNGVTLIGRGVLVSPTLLDRLIAVKRNAQVAEPILIDISDDAGEAESAQARAAHVG